MGFPFTSYRLQCAQQIDQTAALEGRIAAE
jgi:hypothetical protein